MKVFVKKEESTCCCTLPDVAVDCSTNNNKSSSSTELKMLSQSSSVNDNDNDDATTTTTTTKEDNNNSLDYYYFMGCFERPCLKFEELWYRLEILELYKELAIVKDGVTKDTCHVDDVQYIFPNDININDEEDVEDMEDTDTIVKKLRQLDEHCLSVRSLMNSCLPNIQRTNIEIDGSLHVKPSTIHVDVGDGLFYEPTTKKKKKKKQPSPSQPELFPQDEEEEGEEFEVYDDETTSSSPPVVLPAGTIVCYMTGHIHTIQSSRQLQDQSYALLLVAVGGGSDDGNGGSNNCHATATSNTAVVVVDPGPCPTILARYINDPLNDKYYNVKYVPQPNAFRCAVVTTRDIYPGEELFVSYGEYYWNYMRKQHLTPRRKK